MAASIVAKVARDAEMERPESVCPDCGFAKNKTHCRRGQPYLFTCPILRTDLDFTAAATPQPIDTVVCGA